MKKIVRAINDFIVKIFLIIFYIFMVGIAFFIKKIAQFKVNSKSQTTYWLNSDNFAGKSKELESSY